MTLINSDTIRKVADLARLELTPDEVQNYAQSIAGILEHVNQLAQVDTQGVMPMVYGTDHNLSPRQDVVQAFPTTADGKPKVLTSAAEVLYDGFKVPPII